MIVSAFIFYSVYCRLRVFNGIVENSGSQVTEYVLMYKSIVNSLERAKGHLSLLYTFALILRLPELVATTYISLLKIKINYEHDEAYNQILRNFYTMYTFILLTAPAVIAGSVAAAVGDLRVIIHERLLLERDEDYIPELELFLSYVDGRPMQYMVFKIVPLDWSLPVIIFNICISYQIIVVQITNFIWCSR
ncbi:hypothetical protein ABMA27_008204 [Loxostege sticticalis]|uniref:Gustatory receptor n=1 Tax=Loxostege sticticalis TaxID=481309 RepID=A0ABR3HEE6_LOXSC